MAVPPKYDDLGKESRDVFGKGYGKLFSFGNNGLSFLSNNSKQLRRTEHLLCAVTLNVSLVVVVVGFGSVKLDLKTKTKKGVVS